MTESEARRLLVFISAGYDNRALSDATAEVWSEELANVPFDVAREAVRAHFRRTAPRPYLSIDVLIDQIRADNRLTPAAIEADVRSAKARGLLAVSWPRTQPLPAEIARHLAEARQQEAEQLEAIVTRPIADPRSLGDMPNVGRSIA